MQEVTINTNNFDLIEYLNAYYIHDNKGYITKAEDRNGNTGLLLFIPSINNEDSDELIGLLSD